MQNPGGGAESLVPRPRGGLPLVCACVLAAVATGTTLAMIGPEDFVRLVTTAILVLTTGSLLHGVCLLAEEWLFHTTTRYRGRAGLTQVLPACVQQRTLGAVVLAALVLGLMGRPGGGRPGSGGGQSGSGGGHWSLALLSAMLYPLLKTLGALGPCQVEMSEVCEERRMNVAHGLAWSFYLSYLRLVLPRLEGSISEYRSTHTAAAAPFERRGYRRLLLLLPLNANTADKLEDEDPNISFHGNLPDIKIDRAGVRGRVYKHSIYSVLDENGKAHQCVVEYATPLLTLYLMSQESSAGFGERDRREQVLLFYRTLRDVLDQSLDCRNRYRLLLLNDEHGNDPHFLSKTILRHLLQQEREEYCLTPPPHPEAGRPLAAPANNQPVVDDWRRAEPMSREPTLMISQPQPLRGPEETTDNLEDLAFR